MKTIIAFSLAVLVIVTGGLYFFVRKPEAKKNDMGRIAAIPFKLWKSMTAVYAYLVKLFSAKPAVEATDPVPGPVAVN